MPKSVDPVAGRAVFEKRTVIERGRFEVERGDEFDPEGEGAGAPWEGISGPPGGSLSSTMIPEEALPSEGRECGPVGRWEIIVRFAPKEK